MLRKFEKEDILNLFSSLKEAHRADFTANIQEGMEILSGCQEAAVSIGTVLEEKEEASGEIITLLEQYCEKIYQFSCQMQDKRILQEMDELLSRAEEQVSRLAVRWQIVFMPYKAAMWDSLESIYLAAKADPRCECRIVPIPYYEMQTIHHQRVRKLCCDIELFPKELPVTPYQDYPIEKEHPDVIYIHNPFDQYNYVVNLHPSYYSEELTKHTECLVYVPYYVTSGFIDQGYLDLPVNDHADYIIVQSAYAKEYYRGLKSYSKVLPLGSPKLDKVIRLCKQEKKYPKGWKERIGDRKALMLNTSVNCFLGQGEAYLWKLKAIFQWFKEREDVALIWRPHPLLMATIRSMRPQLAEDFERLLQDFKDEQIGILDQTSDIEQTVALSDGYIGENATSVINLFMAAGKPLFILNNFIYASFEAERTYRAAILDLVRCADGFIVNSSYNGLFHATDALTELEYMGRPEDTSVFANLCSGNMEQYKDKLFLTPVLSGDAVVYDMQQGKFQTLFSQQEGRMLQFMGVVSYQNKMYYLPGKGGSIVCMDLERGNAKIYTEAIKLFTTDHDTNGQSEITAFRRDGGLLWLVAGYTNRVICIHMDRDYYDYYEVQECETGFSDIEIDGEAIWLTESKNGILLKCNRRMEVLQRYELSDSIHMWTKQTRWGSAISKIVATEKKLYLFPCFADGAVILDKETGERGRFLEELFDGAGKLQNGYHPQFVPSTGLVKRLNESQLFVQNGFDGRAAIVELDTGEKRYFIPRFTEACIQCLYHGNDGFEKWNRTLDFSRKENMVFTLEGFVEDLVNNRLENAMQRQKKQMYTMTDNLDGNSGEQIHEYMMNQISERN